MTYTIPSWWPWLAGVYTLAAVLLGWRFVRTPHPYLGHKTRCLLWAIRVGAGALVLVLILDWRVTRGRTEDVRPVIQVLIDHSASMATKDADHGRSRYAAAIEALDHILVPAWQDPGRMQIGLAGQGYRHGHPSGASPDAPRSAMGRALREVLETHSRQPFGGVILITDGAATDRDALRATAQDYREARIPVFPWIIGSRDEPDDIRIRQARIFQPSPSQANLRLELDLESPGFAGHSSTLVVRLDDQPLHQQQIRLTGSPQTQVIDFISPYRGLHFYRVEIQPLEGEATTKNNVAFAAAELRREPIRVLYMEGSVPSETAYLRDGLEADPEMEVHALHFPGDRPVPVLAAQARAVRGRDMRVFRDQVGRDVPSVCHPTRGYPKTLEELLAFDVVIFSDIIKEAFSPEQLDATVAFVEEFGGGFVMVGGVSSFGAGEYEKTVIDKLMPIEVANRSDPIFRPIEVEVTETGFQHPIMQVGATAEETRDAWTRSFPGFFGLNYVRRAKPGAFVLARSRSPLRQTNGLVLFAVQQIGRGRTMAFTSDTTRDWGVDFQSIWGPQRRDNTYYRQFWNNTIRWLAADRIARKRGQVTLETSASQAVPDDTVHVYIAAESPTRHAGLEVDLVPPDHTARAMSLQWNAGQRRWEGSFTAAEEGPVILRATYRNDEGRVVTTSTGVYVRPDSNEEVAVAVQRGLMRELAMETGGQLIDAANAETVLASIAERSVPVTWKRAVPVWDRWWILLPLLLLIVGEWILRRYREPA